MNLDIGSMSKLITDIVVLKSGINLDVPVTQYIPQLANSSAKIQWKDISVRMLADHLSGIPPNCTKQENSKTDPLPYSDMARYRWLFRLPLPGRKV